MHRVAVAAVVVSVVGTSLAGVAPASASSAHTALLCRSDSYRCVSQSGYHGQSVWGSWGPGHNCVSYAAYRLRENGAHKPWRGPIGDANVWDDRARAAGLLVDNVPAVGSIAQWDSGTYGHVAYVEAVTADSIVVSEDAYVTDDYGFAQTRRLERRSPQFAAADFIHVRDVDAR